MQLFIFVLYCIQVLIPKKKILPWVGRAPCYSLARRKEDRVAMKNISCVLYYFSLALCLGVRHSVKSSLFLSSRCKTVLFVCFVDKGTCLCGKVRPWGFESILPCLFVVYVRACAAMVPEGTLNRCSQWTVGGIQQLNCVCPIQEKYAKKSAWLWIGLPCWSIDIHSFRPLALKSADTNC